MIASAAGRVLVLTTLLVLPPSLASVAAGQEPDSAAVDVPAQVRYDVMAAALRHAMEYAHEEGTIERLGIEYFCVGIQNDGRKSREDPRPHLFELFRGMRPTVVPGSECEIESSEGYRTRPREGTSFVDHRETGGEAIYFVVTPPNLERKTAASLGVVYFVGPLHAVDFDCDVYRKVIWYAECRGSGRA